MNWTIPRAVPAALAPPEESRTEKPEMSGSPAPFIGDSMKFPLKIQELLSDRALQTETVGLSGAGVWLCSDMVLKSEPVSRESENAAEMMAWLEGKLPAPGLLCRVIENGMDYQLMSRVPGRMSCDPLWMNQPGILAEKLAEALWMLWNIPADGCPCDQSLDHKLTLASQRVNKGLCDPDQVDPATYGAGGFKNPEQLLCWLQDNRPEPDPVLSHGDFCLPNILISDDGRPGFIDLGRAGVSDRYQDIALCWRSMRDNFNGHYGPVYPGFYPELLFDALGMKPDWDRLHYYRLLDELF